MEANQVKPKESGFVKPSKAELKSIIAAKKEAVKIQKKAKREKDVVNFIIRQKDFHKSFITLKGKEARVRALRLKMEALVNLKKENQAFIPKDVTWKGIEYSYDELYWTLQHENMQLSEAISEKNYLQQNLETNGMTDTQLDSIINENKYIKKLPKGELI